MMATLFTIVNPAAGGGRCGKQAPGVLSRLRSAGVDLSVHETHASGHGTVLAREGYASGHRGFLAVGGDGTTFEVVNGLFPRDEGDRDPVTLGMLPLGTGNSFLRDFGILDTEAAVSGLVRGQTHPCDVVAVEHDGGVLHYINLLSLGFSAEAGALTNERFKPLGTLGYVISVLACVARLSHPIIPIHLDGGSVDDRPCELLSFCNSRFTGGTMMMAPDAEVADGRVDVIRVGGFRRLRFVGTFPRIFTGTHLSVRGVETARASRVDFEPSGARDVMVDGEVLRLALSSLSVQPRALSVIA